MPSHSLQSYVATTSEVCSRWGVKLTVPADADDTRAATMIRSALLRAAKAAAAKPGVDFYWDDNSWSHDGVRGVTRARIAEEQELAANPASESTDMWGIVARITCGEDEFDIPIAIDLEEAAAANILDLMDGMEEALVDIEGVDDVVQDDFTITLRAQNWAAVRDEQVDMCFEMIDALALRSPTSWDIMRARLSEMAPEPLPPFDEEAFYARQARSVRFDPGVMSSNRAMVERLASMDVKPGSAKWGEWFPAVVDLLRSIGDPVPMDGMTVLLNFVVEEPLAEQSPEYMDPNHPDHTPFEEWSVVGQHNLVVGFGLHPLTAVHLYDVVLEAPRMFFDLEDADDRRYRLIGASIVQDTMLSMVKASLTGRTSMYEKMYAGQERAIAEEAAERGDDEVEAGEITF